MALANGGSATNYSAVVAQGTAPRGFGHGDPGWSLEGVAGRFDPRSQDDDYTQAGNLFRLLTAAQKDSLVRNIAGALSGVAIDIRERQLAHFDRADGAYGAGARGALLALGR